MRISFPYKALAYGLYLFCLPVMINPAQAACTAPAAGAGDIIFDAGDAILQYCNGTDWVAFPKVPNGDNFCVGTGPWEAFDVDGAYELVSVAYGNGTFAAISWPQNGGVVTSRDGTGWNRHSWGGGQWNGVTFGDGQFVAVAHWNGSKYVKTSPDGAVWEEHNGIAARKFAVAYGNGRYVAAGMDNIETSLNGITWTGVSPAVSGHHGIAYGNGRFVVIRNGAASYSADGTGTSWISTSTGNYAAWRDVTYGNGLFVAVANATVGDTRRITTSSDGITWGRQPAVPDPELLSGWEAVTYGNGLFVAVANGGENRVMTSPDGTTWTPMKAAEALKWSAVTYGNGLFVAVANEPAGAKAAMRAMCRRAGCHDPEAPEGTLVFNGDHRVVQWCDGKDWQAAGPLDPPGPNTGCMNPAHPAGYLLFDKASCAVQYCDGHSWTEIGPPDPCACGGPGTKCNDGTVYVGISSDGNVPIYATPNDSSYMQWGSYGTETLMDNCVSPYTQDSCKTGKANTELLAALGSAYEAATYCDSLEAYGHDDWYLPSREELNLFWNDGSRVAGITSNGSWYWSSSENSNNNVWVQRFNNGGRNANGKSNGYLVRCVRRAE